MYDFSPVYHRETAGGKTSAYHWLGDLIKFYDAGLEPPKYVLYKVTGSEKLARMNGERGTYSETYWISKKGHEFLKEEDSFNGIYRYKLKMPGTVPDLLQKFTGKD